GDEQSSDYQVPKRCLNSLKAYPLFLGRQPNSCCWQRQGCSFFNDTHIYSDYVPHCLTTAPTHTQTDKPPPPPPPTPFSHTHLGQKGPGHLHQCTRLSLTLPCC